MKRESRYAVSDSVLNVCVFGTEVPQSQQENTPRKDYVSMEVKVESKPNECYISLVESISATLFSRVAYEMINITQVLGNEAKSLLEHQCKTIPKESLFLPGPDFVDLVFALSDRPTPVLKSLQQIFGC